MKKRTAASVMRSTVQMAAVVFHQRSIAMENIIAGMCNHLIGVLWSRSEFAQFIPRMFSQIYLKSTRSFFTLGMKVALMSKCF